MLTVVDYHQIRQAYYIENKSMKQIQQELGHSYWTVRKALDAPEPRPYQRTRPAPAPVLDPYKDQIHSLLAENEHLPRKPRYTSRRIYETIRQAGYPGAESSVRRYVAQVRKDGRRPAVESCGGQRMGP